MPSYLGNYAGAASHRDQKIIRAVLSVIDQTFTDWELFIIADGCQKTVELTEQFQSDKVKTILIPKAPLWDGKPRNTGIDNATGDYIIYLDNDDAYGENHLMAIDKQIGDADWVYYNDYIYRSGEWIERHCDINKLGMNGTSNVCHRKSLGVKWGHRGYAHDHYFNQKLLMHLNYKKIETPEYFVMHMPSVYDV